METQLKRRTGAQKGRDEETLGILEKALDSLHSAKSNESELARRYAVTVTELEKVIAYFGIYVVGGP